MLPGTNTPGTRARMQSSSTQSWNPDQYGKHGRFVSDLGAPVVELLDPKPGERILDLGCGDGALSVRLAESGCDLVCVDSSAAMVEAACALGLDARIADGSELQFECEFDAVFSNAALHWMKSPENVVSGVWRALKPGGRFVAEMGGKGNVATILSALDRGVAARGVSVDTPWFFPDADEYRDLLEQAGFRIDTIALVPRPTPLPGALGDWLETFAQIHVSALPAQQRAAFVDEVVETLRPELCDARGNWQADYVRLRFSARKPAAMAPAGQTPPVSSRY